MNKIQVIGIPGSGKSTFAKKLSESLDYKLVELDSKFHLPDWQQRRDKDFQKLVEKEIINVDRWILDGDYHSKLSNEILSQIDTVIWVNPPLYLSIVRLIKRSSKRIITREKLWGINEESIRGALSLVKFAYKKHKELPSQVTDRWAKKEEVNVYLVKNKKQADKLLVKLTLKRVA